MSHKYSAQRTNGFASKLEASVYQVLCLMEKAGEITGIECQVQVSLSGAGIIYKPDFKFWCTTFHEIQYAEAKGYETPEWRLKLRLWKVYGPGKLHIWKGSHLNPKLVETVTPKGQ